VQYEGSCTYFANARPAAAPRSKSNFNRLHFILKFFSLANRRQSLLLTASTQRFCKYGQDKGAFCRVKAQSYKSQIKLPFKVDFARLAGVTQPSCLPHQFQSVYSVGMRNSTCFSIKSLQPEKSLTYSHERTLGLTTTADHREEEEGICAWHNKGC
jgi:hypothetical protein